MNKKIVRTGMILISYVALLALIVVYFKEILSGVSSFLGYATPFIIGLVIAFFLNPPYRLFMKLFKKIKCPEILSRLLSTILVLLFAYGLITGITMIVIPQVTSNFTNFFNNFDQYLISLQGTLDNITDRFNIETLDLNAVVDFVKELGTKIQNSVTEWGPQAFNYTRKVISSITSVLIGIIFSIYILNARDRILRQIHRLTFAIFPEKGYKVLYHVGEVMLKTFDNYVVGQSIEALILGTLCYLGMISFNFAYPGLISVVVAVTALVPIVGTIIGGAVGFFLYLLVDPVKAVIFLIFFTVLQQLENNLIYPKVVGSKIGLPGLWVLFAVMIGSQVGGLLGMLFGVPIFTVLYTLTKDLTVLKEKEKLKFLLPRIKKIKDPEDPESFVIPDIVMNMVEEEMLEEAGNAESGNSVTDKNETETESPTSNINNAESIKSTDNTESEDFTINTVSETVGIMEPNAQSTVSDKKAAPEVIDFADEYNQVSHENISADKNNREILNQTKRNPVIPDTKKPNLDPNPLSPKTMNPNMIANKNNTANSELVSDTIPNNIAIQNGMTNNISHTENQNRNPDENLYTNRNHNPNSNIDTVQNADDSISKTKESNSNTHLQNSVEKPSMVGRRRVAPGKTKERPFFIGRHRNNKE